MELARKVKRNLNLLRKELTVGNPDEEAIRHVPPFRRRPIGPLPRTPCGCGVASAAFHGSLSHLIELTREGDKKKVREQLVNFVIPNQEDFNKVCLLPVGATPVAGARDILAFDLPKRNWQERVEKSARSMQLWITTRLSDCLKKEIIEILK